jgi:hypothetical protein
MRLGKASGTASACAEGDPRGSGRLGSTAEFIANAQRSRIQADSATPALTRYDEDYLSREGAVNLRRWLQEFWRGHPSVKFYIEEKLVPGRGSVHVVRSTLINGKPPVRR